MLLPLSQDETAGLERSALAATSIDMRVLSDGNGAGAAAGSSAFGRSRENSGRSKGSRGKGAARARGAGAQVFRTCSAFPEYFARVLDYRQMDLDATFYQMVTLCVQPSKVYKSAYYRKQTKNRWARDDPAFAAIQFLFLLVATVAWAVAFRAASFSSFVSLLFHAFVVEWLAFGLVISTLCWWIANHHFRLRNSNQGMGDTFYVEQRVEWQYAFDIHCNSFFVLFLFLYVLQFLLAPALASDSFAALLLGNLLYSLGWGFYTYITFLGYMALPFLHRTERFLLPLVLIVGVFVTTLALQAIAGVQVNFAHMSTSYYYSS